MIAAFLIGLAAMTAVSLADSVLRFVDAWRRG